MHMGVEELPAPCPYSLQHPLKAGMGDTLSSSGQGRHGVKKTDLPQSVGGSNERGSEGQRQAGRDHRGGFKDFKEKKPCCGERQNWSQPGPWSRREGERRGQ